MAILLLAAGVRAYRLDAKSLWLDEILMVSASQQGGIFGPYPSLGAAQPPAYLFLLRLAGAISQADWAMRLPAVIASTVGVAALWALGRRMFGPLVALLAAFFLALSAMHIEFAQEAHVYALLATLSTLLLWSLWRAAQREVAEGNRGEPKGSEGNTHARQSTRARTVMWLTTWGPFVLLVVLGLYVHTYALAPTLLSLVVFPLFLRAAQSSTSASPWHDPLQRRGLRHLGLALAVVGLAYLPSLISLLTQASPSGPVANPLSLQSLANLLLAFVTHRSSWLFDPLFFGAVILWWLAGLGWLLWRRRPIGLALALWTLLPVPLIAWLGYQSGLAFAPRRLIFILPVFQLVVAVGVVAVARLGAMVVQAVLPSRRQAAGVAYGLLLAASLLAFVKGSYDPVAFYFRKPKQDWRTLAAILHTQPTARDQVVILPSTDGPLQWYLARQDGSPLAEVSVVEANLGGELERLCLGHDAIYVAEATFRRPLSEEDASYLSDNAIRVPLAELNLYFRNCRPDAWYGAGAQPLFSLAQHTDLDFSATRSAQEQFDILAAQVGSDTPAAAAATQPTTAGPAPQAGSDTPAAAADTQPTTAGPEATPAPSEQATDPEVLLGELIRAAPDEAITQVRLGALALQQGTSLDTAGEHFQQAIDLDPTVWLAYGLWANSLGNSGQITQSLQIVNQGLVAIPDNPALQAMQARLQDGAVSASSGDAYQTALEAGRSALRERNWEDAIGAAQQAVVQAPARYEAQLLLGDAYRGQGELAQALQAYQRATELAPYLSILHSRQAEMLARLGRVDESTAVSLTALAIDQGRWENWYALGRAYQAGALAADAGLATPAAAQAAQQAEAFLLRAQALAPAENQAPARSLAELRAALPQPTASAPAEPVSQPVWDYASMSGQERTAARVQADQTLQAGQPAEALAIYQQLVAVDGQDRASRMGVANALAALGRFDEAMAEFEAISAGWPDFPFAHIRQGALLEERGDLEGALSAYREAVRIAPDNANTHFTLAYALRRAGQRDEAIAAFEAGLELDPSRDSASQVLEALKSGQ